MKPEWEKRKIGQIAEVEYGFTEKARSKGDFRYIRITDITNDGLLTNQEKMYLNSNKELKTYILKSGDLLMARTGATFAKVLYFDDKEPAVFASYLIRIKFLIDILPKLFWYYSKSNQYWEQAKVLSSGAAQPQFNGNALKELYFTFPKSLAEQQRIVTILDQCFAAIDKAKANAEQNLKNAKELFESYLEGVFAKKGEGWEEKTLGDIAIVFGRGKSKHRPRNWPGLYGGRYPFIQTGDVRNADKFISSFSQTYNEVGLAQSKLWKKGTICITIAANIAETAILDFDACIPDSIIGMELNKELADINFVYFLLQYFKRELQKLGKGSAQDNINLGTFDNLYFPVPPLKTQQAIVNQLDQVRVEIQGLENIYQKKIQDLEELKKSILEKAFHGELKTDKISL